MKFVKVLLLAAMMLVSASQAMAFDLSELEGDVTVYTTESSIDTSASDQNHFWKKRAYEGMSCYSDNQCYKGADGLVCHYGQCAHRSRFRYCSQDRDCYRGYDGWRCWENICRPSH